MGPYARSSTNRVSHRATYRVDFARFAAMPDKLYIPMATIATASSSTVTSVPAPTREG